MTREEILTVIEERSRRDRCRVQEAAPELPAHQTLRPFAEPCVFMLGQQIELPQMQFR